MAGKKDLPKFPSKKSFGNKKPQFLENRKKELEIFFNNFFAIPQVSKQGYVIKYFQTRTVGKQDVDNIENLTTYILSQKGKKPNSDPPIKKNNGIEDSKFEESKDGIKDKKFEDTHKKQ